MKQIIIAFLSIYLLSPAVAQTAQSAKIKDLQKLIESKEKIQVINFWATWCGPCVKELPQFEKLNAENKDVKVTLVSLDYDLDPDPAKVNRFIAKRGIKSTVLFLQERDPNSWIDKIETAWSGSIPATIIVNGKTGKRKFIEKALKEGDLEQYIAEVR